MLKDISTEDLETIVANELFGFLHVVHLGQIPRNLTPCIYCHRYDEHVKDLDENGLKGLYHDRCASRVLHDAMKELFVRMS